MVSHIKAFSSQFCSVIIFCCLGILFIGISCSENRAPDASSILKQAIQKHGGDLYRNSITTFTFRGTEYTRYHEKGLFRYTRTYKDSLGQLVYEAINNDSTWQTIDGQHQDLTDSVTTNIYESINSVIYFGFLPFKLQDQAVNAQFLGLDTLDSQPYYEIEVTFDQKKGGNDHQDRFVHWIHQHNYTLDYLAYYYETDESGARFRVAYNRRNINGMIIQDYKNYRTEPNSLMSKSNIQQFDSLYATGQLKLVSTVDLEEVSVKPL